MLIMEVYGGGRTFLSDCPSDKAVLDLLRTITQQDIDRYILDNFKANRPVRKVLEAVLKVLFICDVSC